MADNGSQNNGDGSGLENPHRRPSEIHRDKNGHPAQHNGGAPWGWIVLVLLILVFLGAAAWFAYSHWRARRLGGPPPSLNPFSDRNRIGGGGGGTRSGGLVGWAQEKFGALRRQRTAGGAYEGTTASARRGRGMDPDEAWDTRVGTEADVYGGPPAYYEEQELSGFSRGIHDGHNDSAYAGGGYGRPGYGPDGTLDDIDHEEDRGRKSELDRRYDEETGRATNPFEDHAEPSGLSLRGVSPRPAEDPSSPTSRRSMFKENV